MEFTISADPFVSNDPTGFSWHTDLTLTHNKGTFNKIPTYNHRQQQAGNYQNELFQMVEGENWPASGDILTKVCGRKVM